MISAVSIPFAHCFHHVDDITSQLNPTQPSFFSHLFLFLFSLEFSIEASQPTFLRVQFVFIIL